jgi:hypothetical protein
VSGLDALDEREVWDAVVDMVLDATEEVLDGSRAELTKKVRRELHGVGGIDRDVPDPRARFAELSKRLRALGFAIVRSR